MKAGTFTIMISSILTVDFINILGALDIIDLA